MPPDHSSFEASLAQLVAAHRARNSAPAAYDRAWTSFWFDHFRSFLDQARAFAARQRGLGAHLDRVESELVERTLKRLASGDELNRLVLFGIRKIAIAEVGEQVARLDRPDVLEGAARRIRDAGTSDEVMHRAMRARLDQVVADVHAGHRSKLKAEVLQAILDDRGRKDNGELSFAQIARHLDRPEGTIRRTFSELVDDLSQRFPDLLDFLEDSSTALDGELFELTPKEPR